MKLSKLQYSIKMFRLNLWRVHCFKRSAIFSMSSYLLPLSKHLHLKLGCYMMRLDNIIVIFSPSMRIWIAEHSDMAKHWPPSFSLCSLRNHSYYIQDPTKSWVNVLNKISLKREKIIFVGIRKRLIIFQLNVTTVEYK